MDVLALLEIASEISDLAKIRNKACHAQRLIGNWRQWYGKMVSSPAEKVVLSDPSENVMSAHALEGEVSTQRRFFPASSLDGNAWQGTLPLPLMSIYRGDDSWQHRKFTILSVLSFMR